MAGAQFDADHGGLCGLVAPRVELSGLGHGLLAGPEGALLAALLACLRESGDVALVRVHDPPREAGAAAVTAARIRSATRSTASLLRSKTFTKAKKG